MNKNQQEIINLLGYMVLAPTKETPAKKPSKKKDQTRQPSPVPTSKILNNDKTYTTICYNRFTNITVNIF